MKIVDYIPRRQSRNADFERYILKSINLVFLRCKFQFSVLEPWLRFYYQVVGLSSTLFNIPTSAYPTRCFLVRSINFVFLRCKFQFSVLEPWLRFNCQVVGLSSSLFDIPGHNYGLKVIGIFNKIMFHTAGPRLDPWAAPDVFSFNIIACRGTQFLICFQSS